MMTLAAPGDGRNTTGHLVPALDKHRGSGMLVVTATFQNTQESQGSNPIPTHKNNFDSGFLHQSPKWQR